MEGLRTYGREWKKIAAMIPSRTVVQIRTHAQKHFQKLSKLEGKDDSHHSGSGGDSSSAPPHSERKRLKLSAPGKHPSKDTSTIASGGSSGASHGNSTTSMDSARDISAMAGGITPRTVAAATILLGPRYQSKEPGPQSEWIKRQSANALEVLENRRRTSPRLNVPIPRWPETNPNPPSNPPSAETAPATVTSHTDAS